MLHIEHSEYRDPVFIWKPIENLFPNDSSAFKEALADIIERAIPYCWSFWKDNIMQLNEYKATIAQAIAAFDKLPETIEVTNIEEIKGKLQKAIDCHNESKRSFKEAIDILNEIDTTKIFGVRRRKMAEIIWDLKALIENEIQRRMKSRPKLRVGNLRNQWGLIAAILTRFRLFPAVNNFDPSYSYPLDSATVRKFAYRYKP